jgi:hypothetical protein
VTIRSTTKTVTFRRPFFLKGADGAQLPGTYEVETLEEQIPGLSFLAYRRLSTTIVLSVPYGGGAVRQLVTIDAADLEAAQAGDLVYVRKAPPPRTLSPARCAEIKVTGRVIS